MPSKKNNEIYSRYINPILTTFLKIFSSENNFILIKNKSSISLKSNDQTIKIFFLFFIILSTISIHIWAIDKSSSGREIIWEPDDQYHELVKAKNLDSCKNNCLAVNNLSTYNKDFLNDIVKDWELTQIILSKIVTTLLIISFAVFVLVHFNLNICLISSIIILPYATIKWGFHFSNSSAHLSSVFGIFSLIFFIQN